MGTCFQQDAWSHAPAKFAAFAPARLQPLSNPAAHMSGQQDMQALRNPLVEMGQKNSWKKGHEKKLAKKEAKKKDWQERVFARIRKDREERGVPETPSSDAPAIDDGRKTTWIGEENVQG